MIEFNEYNCNNAQDVKDYFLKLDKATIENAEEFKGVFREKPYMGDDRIIKFEEKGKKILLFKNTFLLLSPYFLYKFPSFLRLK